MLILSEAQAVLLRHIGGSFDAPEWAKDATTGMWGVGSNPELTLTQAEYLNLETAFNQNGYSPLTAANTQAPPKSAVNDAIKAANRQAELEADAALRLAADTEIRREKELGETIDRETAAYVKDAKFKAQSEAEYEARAKELYPDLTPAQEAALTETLAYRAHTDHGGPDPFQGYDVEIWVQRTDLTSEGSGTFLKENYFDTHAIQGGMILLGQFTGGSIGLRMSSEAYTEYDSRVPIYMDGESQITFKLEKGLVNMDVFRETFGMSVIGRRTHYNVSPRLNITFNVNTTSYNPDDGFYRNELNKTVTYGGIPTVTLRGDDANSQPDTAAAKFTRHVNGRFVLKGCKIDAFNVDFSAGKHVVATNWMGVAEELVSLAGDPPQMTDRTGMTAENASGALDGFPSMGSSTELPSDMAREQEARLKATEARKRHLMASGGFRYPETVDRIINAELGQADTTLPAQEIIQRERDQRIKEFGNAATKELVKGAVSLGQEQVESHAAAALAADSTLSAAEKQRVAAKLDKNAQQQVPLFDSMLKGGSDLLSQGQQIGQQFLGNAGQFLNSKPFGF